MGINIGICELEAKSASCAELKKEIHKVMLTDIKGFEAAAEFDEKVSLEEAARLFPDWEAFVKRNRLNAEADAVYLEKIKNDADMAVLKPKAVRTATGWVNLSKLDAAAKKKAVEASAPENRLTGWDLVEFDEMNKMCSECGLSWDKGRGCIGAFGPDNGALPEIAAKYGCPIIASVPESAKVKKRFSPEDGKKLLAEVDKLNAVLPDEGKMAVRRYGGPLERVGAVAKVSVDNNCGFFFF